MLCFGLKHVDWLFRLVLPVARWLVWFVAMCAEAMLKKVHSLDSTYPNRKTDVVLRLGAKRQSLTSHVSVSSIQPRHVSPVFRIPALSRIRVFLEWDHDDRGIYGQVAKHILNLIKFVMRNLISSDISIRMMSYIMGEKPTTPQFMWHQAKPCSPHTFKTVLTISLPPQQTSYSCRQVQRFRPGGYASAQASHC